MRIVYPIEIQSQDYCIIVTFPDLPEANTFGNDLKEALASAVNCLDVALSSRIRDRLDIPLPSPAHGRKTIAPSNMIAAKTALCLAMKESGIHQSALARLLNIDQSSINRMLNPAHASRQDQIDKAVAVLGKRIVISVER